MKRDRNSFVFPVIRSSGNFGLFFGPGNDLIPVMIMKREQLIHRTEFFKDFGSTLAILITERMNNIDLFGIFRFTDTDTHKISPEILYHRILQNTTYKNIKFDKIMIKKDLF